MWAGHAWRIEGSLIKTVIEENLIGKRPLGRPRLRWEDRAGKDVKAVEPNIRRKEVTGDSNHEIIYTGPRLKARAENLSG